ncbi:hypothetical protein [Azospirillum sp. Marseille-Q6669]
MAKRQSHLRVAADPEQVDSLFGLERSVRVSTAATLLDADEWHIRKLLKDGELQGHRLGKRGVRILVSSIEDYRNRGKIANSGKRVPPKPKPTKASAAHLEALSYLQQLGILPQPSNGAAKPRGRQ